LVVEDAGLVTAAIAFSAHARNNWQEILREALRKNRVGAILEVVARDYADSPLYLQARLFYIVSYAGVATEIIATAYRESLPSSQQLRTTPPELGNMTDDLWERRRLRHNSFPSVFQFTARIARQTEDPQIAEELRNWMRSAIPYVDASLTAANLEAMDAVIAAMDAAPPPAPSHLIVELAPETEDEEATQHTHYRLEVLFWRHGARAPILWYSAEEPSLSLEEVPEQLNKILTAHKNTWVGSELILEFFVPLNLICAEIDQWENKMARTKGAKYGMDYPVVIRSLERVRDRVGWSKWRQKWRQFQYLAQLHHMEHVYWISSRDQYEPLVLRNQVLDPEDVICLALAYAPAPHLDKERIFDPLLDAGLPVAFWPRPCAYVADQPQIIQTLLQQMFVGQPLAMLPKQVQKARLAAVGDNAQALANYLTLLWDDPERIPPKYLPAARFHAPAQTI
jgi:hypothetical protein